MFQASAYIRVTVIDTNDCPWSPQTRPAIVRSTREIASTTPGPALAGWGNSWSIQAGLDRAHRLRAEVDQAGNIELERHIRELGDQLRQGDSALAEARAERDEQRVKLREAEDTVAAHRQSLKQMMRDQSI